MSRILLLFAHPAFEKSKLNRALLETARKVRGITVHDLYEEYPYFDIDVEREQALLLEHDTIVLQHPLHWYSSPSLLNDWFDLVLENARSYGRGRYQLHGKKFIQAIIDGGCKDSYRPLESSQFSIPQFLRPAGQTANLSGINWLPPFVVNSSNEGSEIAASQYIEILEGLRDDSLDTQAAQEFDLMDDYLGSLSHA